MILRALFARLCQIISEIKVLKVHPGAAERNMIQRFHSSIRRQEDSSKAKKREYSKHNVLKFRGTSFFIQDTRTSAAICNLLINTSLL